MLAAVIVLGVGAVSVTGSDDLDGVASFLLTGWLVAVIAPAAGPGRLGELTEAARSAGLAVRTHTDGAPRRLPTEVDLRRSASPRRR